MFFSTFPFLKCYLFIFGCAVSSLVSRSHLFFSCRDQGLFFVAMCGLFIVVAFLVVEHGL